MSTGQTNNIPQISPAQRVLELRKASDQFFRGEVSAKQLQIVENQYNPGLKSAVLALAQRNIKQHKS